MALAIQRPHNITAARARLLFGKKIGSKLSETDFELFAGSINRCRWPGDPAARPGEPGYVKTRAKEAEPFKWPFDQAAETTKAARLLVKMLPIIADHWHDQGRFLSDYSEYAKLLELEEVLSASMPLIEHPLGKAEQRPGAPKFSKGWQSYAFLIARRAIYLLNKAGDGQPSLDRNSIVARVVHETLEQMKVEGVQLVTTSGISAFLVRWHQHYRLVPEGVAAMTTTTA